MANKKEETILEAKGFAFEGEEMVEFTAPYVPGMLEEDLPLIRNGAKITLKRGETVKIPAGYKAIYDRSQEAIKAANKRASKMHEDFMKAGM